MDSKSCRSYVFDRAWRCLDGFQHIWQEGRSKMSAGFVRNGSYETHFHEAGPAQMDSQA